jgi:hypothetical protein
VATAARVAVHATRSPATIWAECHIVAKEGASFEADRLAPLCAAAGPLITTVAIIAVRGSELVSL